MKAADIVIKKCQEYYFGRVFYFEKSGMCTMVKFQGLDHAKLIVETLWKEGAINPEERAHLLDCIERKMSLLPLKPFRVAV